MHVAAWIVWEQVALVGREGFVLNREQDSMSRFVREIKLTQFSSVQSLCCVQLFVTPWTAAHQASLSSTISGSLLKFMSVELVMLSNHLILCCPLLHHL